MAGSACVAEFADPLSEVIVLPVNAKVIEHPAKLIGCRDRDGVGLVQRDATGLHVRQQRKRRRNRCLRAKRFR